MKKTLIMTTLYIFNLSNAQPGSSETPQSENPKVVREIDYENPPVKGDIPSGFAATDTAIPQKKQSNRVQTIDKSSRLNTAPSESNYRQNDNLSGGATAGSDSETAAGSAAGTSGKTIKLGNEGTVQDNARTRQELTLEDRIKTALREDKNLSNKAKQVKVLRNHGQIHLVGSVANSSERSRIESIAKQKAGNTIVINKTQIE